MYVCMAEFSSDVYVLNLPFHLLLSLASSTEFSGGVVCMCAMCDTDMYTLCVCVRVCCEP